MTSLCITGLSDSAIEVVDQALQAAGVAPAQTAQRDSELSFASWHDRVYKSIEQGQGESSADAGSLTELPAMGRLWEQLASDLFLSNIQTPLWSWSNAKSLGLLDYWLAFDAGIHFVLVATSPEQMLAENLAKLAVDNTDHKKSLAAMPVESLLAQWHKAHHAMLRFSLRHPERCILVLAEDLEQHELVSAAKAKWPKALNALRVPKMSAPSVVAELSLSPADQVLRHYATQLCEAYPQANSLHEEIASVATVAATQNTDKFAKDGVLHGVLATVALAHKVPLLLSQVTEVSTSRDSLLKDEAKLKNQLELEVSAKKQLQAQLTEQAKANAVLLEEKAVLLQEVQTRGQEAQANKSALEAEVTAKTQVMVALREEKALQKSVDEEKALLLTQLHQVQEELEKYYLKCKTLDKEIKTLIDSRPDFENKTKAAASAAFVKEREALTSDNARLAQEKAKLIEARDSLVQARSEVQEKLNKAGESRNLVVQEKIALSQKVKELIAAREVEIKRKTDLQAKLEEEIKAKNVLVSEITKLSQEKAKLIEVRESLVQARAEVQEKLNKAGQSRSEVVQEKIALSLKVKELIAAREVEIKRKLELQGKLEEESKAKNLLASEITQLKQEMDKLIENDANLRVDLETKLQTETQARATLKQEIAVHVQEKATLGQEKTKLIAARDAESKAKAAALDNLAKAEARAKSAEDESAMMLAQLHKLQEDAERYDQRIKDLQANLNQATARFRRVTSRQPDGIDWESVQTQPLLIEGRPALQCRATNVAVMGKEWKSLEFVAFIQDGALAFNFVPSSDADVTGPLTRLPRGLGSIDQFTARAGKESAGQLGMELLKDLSTSDWDLLRGLPRMLSLGLQYVRGAWPSGMPGPTVWESAAKATLPALLRVPMSLRFDTFKLQGATAVPSYEQLRLRLDPLSLGKKRFAAFEFGFGCNLNQGRNFGTNARLEFFKGSGTSTFDQWVPNVRDGTVERLDLVFVFPTSMNLKDWSALSVSDRSLVLLLADQLPGMLEELVQGSVQIARPMSEWIALAEKLRAFVRTRLDVTGVQKQPNTLVDAVPGAVPQDAPSMPARRRASIAKSSVSDIKKQRAIGKTTVAAKKLAVSTSSARGSVRSEPARAQKK